MNEHTNRTYFDGVHPYPVKVPDSPEEKARKTARRRAAARIANQTRWAHESDRVAATEAARRKFDERFLDEVDPERVLEPTERARRAAHARSAYFTRLAMKSAESRARRKEQR